MRGRDMVTRMLSTLHAEGESAWVQSITKELCCGASQFLQSPRCCALLRTRTGAPVLGSMVKCKARQGRHECACLRVKLQVMQVCVPGDVCG